MKAYRLSFIRDNITYYYSQKGRDNGIGDFLTNPTTIAQLIDNDMYTIEEFDITQGKEIKVVSFKDVNKYDKVKFTFIDFATKTERMFASRYLIPDNIYTVINKQSYANNVNPSFELAEVPGKLFRASMFSPA